MTNTVVKPDYVLPPFSGKKPSQLVILLHGVGANGEDLLSLAYSWQPLLPDAEFISPNAPFAFEGGRYGDIDAYEWFSLNDITLENREERVRAVAPLLDQFIDEALAKRGLTDDQLALVGFSQGTIMSLYTSIRRARPCAGVLGYSGRFADAAHLADEIRSRPRIFLLHGTADSVIPVSEMHEAETILKAYDIPVITKAFPGLPHSINEEGIVLGGQFLAFCLKNTQSALSEFSARPV